MSVREEYREMDVVVAARDGDHAVVVTLYEGTYRIPNRIAGGCYFSFLQEDRTTVGRVGVMFSGLGGTMNCHHRSSAEPVDRTHPSRPP